ncbi:MAG: transcriptional repressor LexA [Firmicutes bacterium]|nr:transcriptional repressor LexA [Bacillota bacterium]
MEELTERQRAILSFIKTEILRKGYPPSVREIGEAVGLSSSSTVHAHLSNLEEMGYIRRDPSKPRAIEVLINPEDPRQRQRLVHLPIVGRVAAGQPLLAVENIEDYFPLPRDFGPIEDGFMLRVRGESMIEAGIHDGDLLVVQRTSTAENGDIVVALIEEEATVKRFFREDGRIRLQPENRAMAPIYATEVTIVGRVVGLIRRIR